MRVLEVLRQPVEDKIVTISRANGSLTFPANFQLIGAMNPCPCGSYGDGWRSVKPCTCSSRTVTKYQKRSYLRPHLRPAFGPHRPKRSGHIEVPRVEYDKLSERRLGEPSECIRVRVEAARERQRERFRRCGRRPPLPMPV